MKVSLRQQIEEVDRELAQRSRVYQRLVAKGELRQAVADFQVARLVAARDTLAWLADHERLIKQRLAY
ncbi:MAG: hypothetical protein IT481_08700 [Gammaproteobacteria bacterium]|nr:hypothetical protein [Gammaproteobacteria bacterium]